VGKMNKDDNLNTEELNKKHDRELIEKGFEDFEEGRFVTEEEMVKEFGNDGWGE